MASKSTKDYCEDSRSRVDDLFESTDDIMNRKPSLSIYGEKFTFDQLQSAMFEQSPFIMTKEVSSCINLNSITKSDIVLFENTLEQIIPRANEPCLIQWFCAKKFEEVAFFDSAVKNNKLLPPRMVIDVGQVPPNSSVRINTGYIFKIPSKVEMLDTKDGRIVPTGYKKQWPFVILPQIVCEHEGFIPTVYARDPEDTGMFTINFTTQSGMVGKLRVVLKAFRVVSARDKVRVTESEQHNSAVFKPKDQNVGRLVYNPKPKIVFESMRCEKDDNRVFFKTYDSTQKIKRVFEKQQVCIENLNTLIVSRKREWHDSGLVTLSGVFVPSYTKSGVNYLAPKVATGSEYNANTHCLCFVDCRLNLFSARVSNCSDVKIINGAFCDTDSYGDVSKAVRKIILSMNGLSVGVRHCTNIVSRHPDLPLDRLILLLDYHKTVLECDDQLKEKCLKSDEAMYNSKPSHAEAYSVTLYRSFRFLVAVYFASRFTDSQIEELKLSKNGNNVKTGRTGSTSRHGDSLQLDVGSDVMVGTGHDSVEQPQLHDVEVPSHSDHNHIASLRKELVEKGNENFDGVAEVIALQSLKRKTNVDLTTLLNDASEKIVKYE